MNPENKRVSSTNDKSALCLGLIVRAYPREDVAPTSVRRSRRGSPVRPHTARWLRWRQSFDRSFISPSRVYFVHGSEVVSGGFWRKADIEVYLNLDQFVPFAGATSILFVMDESKCCTKPRLH
jgi:hypothetical protein